MWLAHILIISIVVISVGASAGPIHDASKAGDLAAVEWLLAEGINANEITYPDGSPLHIASREGHLAIVDHLISAGVDIDPLEFVKDETPLHLAAAAGQADVVEALVRAGADIEARGNWGYTPLMKAVQNGNQAAALKLIELGADTGTRSDAGLSPLQKAGEASLWKVVEKLFELGEGPAPPADIKPLLANANTERGAQLYHDEGCHSCHDLGSGGVGTAPGPPLESVVGRDIASVEDFKYSQALRRLDGVWDYDSLNRLLADASGFYPGNKMIVMGNRIEISKPEDRADIIAYLRIRDNRPLPLP